MNYPVFNTECCSNKILQCTQNVFKLPYRKIDPRTSFSVLDDIP
jgi:hypothetical protein